MEKVEEYRASGGERLAGGGGIETAAGEPMGENGQFTDIGEDWVSLFFDDSFFNDSVELSERSNVACFPADALAGDLPMSQSATIFSSSAGRISAAVPEDLGAPNYSRVSDGSSSFVVPQPGTTSFAPLIERACVPTASPDSALTQVSGESSCGVQQMWWGNEAVGEDEDEDEDEEVEEEEEEEGETVALPGHGSEEESSTSFGDGQKDDPRGSQAQMKGSVEVGSGSGRGSGERNDRKRRSWEREEIQVEKTSCTDQSGSQCESDRRGETGEGVGEEDDEKRQARLMRNRESAQLSRQRKKVYVDELESRLRTMAATIAELNATVNHLTVENVNLRRQLGFFYQPTRPGGMAVLPYPGLITARPFYPGAPMPPVPIPRLKPQGSMGKSSKRTKCTKASGEPRKAKKVASLATVGVMGLLCIAMLITPSDWWGSPNSGTTHIHVSNAEIRVGGRVLTSWNEEGSLVNLTSQPEWGDAGEQIGMDSGGARRVIDKHKIRSEKRHGNALRKKSTTVSDRVREACSSDCYNRGDEPLGAKRMGERIIAANMSEEVSLIVPRNNRLVKVDGNLIIRAVMAGDKAAQDLGREETASREREKARGNMKQDAPRRGRSLPTPADHQLIRAIAAKAQEGGGTVVGEREVPKKNIGVIMEDSKLKPAYKSDALASVPAPGTLQQWVLGGLSALKKGQNIVDGIMKEAFVSPSDNTRAFFVTPKSLLGSRGSPPVAMIERLEQLVLDTYPGPVLSTGMCTEVFRFDTSPAGAAQTTQSSGTSKSVVEEQVDAADQEKTATSSSREDLPRNRKNPSAVPLPPIRSRGKHKTDPVVEKIGKAEHSETGNPQASTMVVSVFTGPQDLGGEDGRTGTGGASGLSQIFVVVLVDNVKYITYSCTIPSSGSQVHVVAR